MKYFILKFAISDKDGIMSREQLGEGLQNRTEQNFIAYKTQATRRWRKSMHIHVNKQTYRM